MKYCTHCGNQLVDEAVICPKCGCPTEMFNQAGYTQFGGYSQNIQSTPSVPAGGQLSALSIVGFIFAFLSPLVGLVCSIIAHKIAVSENNFRSKSFSKSGIIISIVFLVLTVLFWTLMIVLAINGELEDPDVGYYYGY